jgi:DEAD/DEAH box helicase domain-containing protein
MTSPQRPPDGSFARPAAPWKHATGLDAVLARWRADGSIGRNVVLDRTLPARASKTAPFPAALHPDVEEALKARGLTELWSHQADAFLRATGGEDIVVATPTASGKSLCYNLPVLDRLAREPDARALYLFPTKALSRDQEEALHKLLREAKLGHGAITYDGDTPGDARRVARERSGVLLTNPDMLHAGILPHHASWARFFSCLRYVVIDELHTYRGVFGSHLANVIRRLDRIARFHGAKPIYVFASATIGNPESHASRMLGRPVSLVGESGAPAGEKNVVIYDPPIVNRELGLRASYVKTAVNLVADLVAAEVPTLVFGQSRNQVETMLKYLRDRLTSQGLDPSALHAYRSGYLPETRRRIEQGLRAGTIRCVVATNALELGIDVGSLDAVVCAGYPGSIASTWQRFGRAGRRQGSSLALLVPSSMPLDQYVARNPELLVGAPVEEARIDPDNVEILLQHLKCASFELPFEEGETFGDVPQEAVADSMGYLAQQKVVVEASQGGKRAWHWSTDAYPASHVSLRSLSWDNFVIIDLDGDRTIAEMDWRATHTMLHVQAIYQHEGEQYQVERLDFENHKAYIRKVAPDYFTTAMTYTRVSITQEDDGAPMMGMGTDGALVALAAGVGEVSVIEKVVGYKKIKFHTHENVGYGDVRLPEMQMHTSAYWLTFPEEIVRTQQHHRSDGITLEVPRAWVVDAIRGVGHAMQTVATVGLMCDPRDIGIAMGDRSAEGELPGTGEGGAGFDPTVFLYDSVPGGVGLAPRLFSERETLLRRTRSLIESCACDEGCPACIGVSGGSEPVPSASGAPEVRRSPLAGLSLKRLALDLLASVGAAPVH